MQEINGSSLRILKYLAKRKSLNIVYGSIAMGVGIASFDECKKQCEVLLQKNLIDEEINKVKINQKGIDELNKILQAEDDKICEHIFTDFEFALIKFLHELGEPIDLDEFPQIFMDRCPPQIASSGYYSPSGHLMHYLHAHSNFEQTRHNHWQLSSSGQRYYKFKR